jgi:penicillin-binding protein 1C
MSAPGQKNIDSGCGLRKSGKNYSRKIIIRLLLWPFLLASLLWAFLAFYPDPLKDPFSETLSFTDRRGEILTKIPSSWGYRESRPLDRFSPHLIQAVLVAEDRLFFSHHGINPLALIRSSYKNIRHKSFRFGGSTLTMQLARLTQGLTPGPRTLKRKFKEIFLALVIERQHSKEEILAAYLNSVPISPLKWGLATAARDLFNKDISQVSPAEAAFLASLPKNPDTGRMTRLLERQKRILKAMNDHGYLDEQAYKRALTESLALEPNKRPYLAPHFLNYIQNTADLSPEDPAVSSDEDPLAKPVPASSVTASYVTQGASDPAKPGPDTVVTTLDLKIQRQIEKLVADTVRNHKSQGLRQAAVVVMSLPEREILAWVGSADFYDPTEGQNDGVLALRQPGSALKPFIYQLALSQGTITAGTVLNDQPVSFIGPTGAFSPQNYSQQYHGQVSARTSLASSLNIPAINLVKLLGPEAVLSHLRRLGLISLSQESDYYGLGLAIGNGEVSLLALTNAYATLGLLGRHGLPVFHKGQKSPDLGPITDPASTWLVGQILADDHARVLGFGRRGILATPYPASVKTGTSQNFKDNWCLGFTDRFVVGVWAGNFQAAPMAEVSGVVGAGTLWRQIADSLAELSEPSPIKRPPGLISARICPISGLLLGPDCPNETEEFFLERWPLPEECDHRRMENPSAPSDSLILLSPLNNEIYALDPGLPAAYQNLTARVRLGENISELIWLLDGREIARSKTVTAGNSALIPLSKGQKHLTVLGLRDEQTVARAEARFLVK